MYFLFIPRYGGVAFSPSRSSGTTHMSKRDVYSSKEPYVNHTYVKKRCISYLYHDMDVLRSLPLEAQIPHIFFKKRPAFFETNLYEPHICQQQIFFDLYDDMEVLRSLPLEARVSHTCQKEIYIHQNNPTCTTHMSKRDLYSWKQSNMYHSYVKKRPIFIKTTKYVPHVCQKETCIHQNNQIWTTHMSKRDLYSSKQPNMNHTYVKKRRIYDVFDNMRVLHLFPLEAQVPRTC